MDKCTNSPNHMFIFLFSLFTLFTTVYPQFTNNWGNAETHVNVHVTWTLKGLLLYNMKHAMINNLLDLFSGWIY